MKWLWYACVSVLICACEWSRPPNATCFDQPLLAQCWCVLHEDPSEGSTACPEEYGCCILTIERTVGGDPQVLDCTCDHFGEEYGCYSLTHADGTQKVRVSACTAQLVEEVEHRGIAPIVIADEEPRR